MEKKNKKEKMEAIRKKEARKKQGWLYVKATSEHKALVFGPLAVAAGVAKAAQGWLKIPQTEAREAMVLGPLAVAAGLDHAAAAKEEEKENRKKQGWLYVDKMLLGPLGVAAAVAKAAEGWLQINGRIRKIFGPLALEAGLQAALQEGYN